MVHRYPSRLVLLGGLTLTALLLLYSQFNEQFQSKFFHKHHKHRPPHAHEIVARCRQLKIQAGPSEDFLRRSVSDRFEHGTKPVLIKRARIWTGGKNGTEIINRDILLDKGLIKSIGHLDAASLASQLSRRGLIVVDVNGAWVTPGIVDIHSHLGDAPSPELKGAVDDNSEKGTIQPWLRSLDGINTHDDSYPLSIAGGVTTSLVLPGSANAIGGQAYVMKLRETSERSPSSMLLEPPYHINNSFPNPNLPPRWRHMKHACGENPSGTYKATRMDTIWAFREAYNTAMKIKGQQDEFCSRALSSKWKGIGEFPDPFQWEALVDVLRGRVKVNAHCYEAVDLDALVRLSNEFKFPIAAFHHASEAYLVPEVLKKSYGKPPAVALFATNARYKREAYRASEFAPRILAKNGITVLMKSDHPVMNSRYLLYEAQQAFYYGLPYNLALASVISSSAEVMGMGHRIGYVKEGYDADLVIWDSHPLALGATPTQVFIDGIPQFERAHIVEKPENYHRLPKVPNFDQETELAVAYEGLPPLSSPKKDAFNSTTIFLNVKGVMTRGAGTIGVERVFAAQGKDNLGVVVVENGTILCIGDQFACPLSNFADNPDVVDLEGGSITPALVSFGSPLGLQHIEAESSTNDGYVYDPLLKSVPDIIGDTAIVRAADGLEYGSRDALLAYRFGVTTAITAPSHKGFYGGLGTFFSLGASHKLEKGAFLQEVSAVHISIRHFAKPSVSTQIAALRRLLFGKNEGAVGHWFDKVKTGHTPLVVEAHSADIIATLLVLKKELEAETRIPMKLTITGGAEAHILAKELGDAAVGVILSPPRPFPYVWEDRRILPGPPITNSSAIAVLLDNNVVVGLGCEEIWSARNLPFDVAWAAIEAGGRISREQAIALGSTNIERLLGVERDPEMVDLVAYRGGDFFNLESKVVAIISPESRTVHQWNV